MSSMLQKVQGIVNTTVNQQSVSSVAQDLSQPLDASNMDDSQDPLCLGIILRQIYRWLILCLTFPMSSW